MQSRKSVVMCCLCYVGIRHRAASRASRRTPTSRLLITAFKLTAISCDEAKSSVLISSPVSEPTSRCLRQQLKPCTAQLGACCISLLRAGVRPRAAFNYSVVAVRLQMLEMLSHGAGHFNGYVGGVLTGPRDALFAYDLCVGPQSSGAAFACRFRPM